MEHNSWKEVVLKPQAEMLGLSEWVLLTTWSVAAHQRPASSTRTYPGIVLEGTEKVPYFQQPG